MLPFVCIHKLDGECGTHWLPLADKAENKTP